MTKYFPKAVLMTAALYAVFFFLPYSWQFIYAEEIVYVLSTNGVGAVLESPNLFLTIYSILYVLSLLGLYSYKKWAKWLFIALIAFQLLIAPYVLGISVSVYLDMSLGYLLSLFEGALLLMLFSDEISSKLK
ncbi:hypothetical protein [Pseudidiomarina sediminum]|uniref:hypothetical protein n=1 Tax=Pseudidiomarina sediminum TaxID=431675 RepID=UPI001C9581C3|nr:hypothetical protein [Pseudidiomarina sediminum]MBY6064112.1 hypothetical protein [Pseudidiomarina sediminum]